MNSGAPVMFTRTNVFYGFQVAGARFFGLLEGVEEICQISVPTSEQLE